MAGSTVQLLGNWASPSALRVKWALELKGVQYEYIEEDLPNKSPLLLQYNPVHKKVPVLVHDGKPLAESLLIIEFIDEVWKQNSFLPQDPYERAKARFWAKFAEEKCVPAIMGAFVKEGEEKEKHAKEASENLKTLESALEGKQFFGGETIGSRGERQVSPNRLNFTTITKDVNCRLKGQENKWGKDLREL